MSATYISVELRRLVRDRARDRCEYCGLPESVAFVPHQVDHVVAEKHRGATAEENLAMSCKLRIRHKGSDIASFDPNGDALVPLFHPRRDRWADHFRLEASGAIEPLTPVGRVTILVLQMNHPDRVAERRLLKAVVSHDPS